MPAKELESPTDAARTGWLNRNIMAMRLASFFRLC